MVEDRYNLRSTVYVITPAVILALFIVGADLILGPQVKLGALLVLPPLLTCMRGGARLTAGVALLSLAIAGALGFANEYFASADQLTRVVPVALGGAATMVIALIRQEREDTEQRLSAMVENALECVISMDHHGTVIEFNPAAEATFGYERSEAIGRELAELIVPPAMREGHRQGLARYRETGTSQILGRRIEIDGMRADGSLLAVELTITHTGDTGRQPLFTAFLRDITERKDTEERLAHLALHDALTDLPNRRLLVDRLQFARRRARRTEAPTALLYLDLDGFKAINDDLGHAAGDELLVAVGDRLKRAVRPADTIARLGGDEFAVVCEDMHDEDEAVSVATRICSAIESPIELADGRRATVGISVGVAISRSEEETSDSLLGRADAAMYRAKDRSRRPEPSLQVCLDAA